jgi:C1A family cysteine protease
MSKRILNWRPDLPDTRDLIYQPLGWVPYFLLPKRVDLRPMCSPVEDQGPIGSCTGNAIAGAIELLEVKKGMKHTDISRLFIYYNERVYINTVREDSGAYIRDGIKSIRKIGAAAEKLWPYDVTKYAEKPSDLAYQDAADRKFKNYYRVLTLNAALNAIANEFPVIFGFTVYTSFLSDAVARTGIMSMPKRGDREEGGHAVLAVGYDKKKGHVICRNSWGKEWGDKGYFYMPLDYLADRNLSDDLWVLKGEYQ